MSTPFGVFLDLFVFVIMLPGKPLIVHELYLAKLHRHFQSIHAQSQVAIQAGFVPIKNYVRTRRTVETLVALFYASYLYHAYGLVFIALISILSRAARHIICYYSSMKLFNNYILNRTFNRTPIFKVTVDLVPNESFYIDEMFLTAHTCDETHDTDTFIGENEKSN